MRYVKTTMILVASLVLTVLLGLAGCGEDHRRHRIYVEPDRSPERYERQGGERHEERGREVGHDRDDRDHR